MGYTLEQQIQNTIDEIDRLKAENARLQRAHNVLNAMWTHAEGENKKLETENARLRAALSEAYPIVAGRVIQLREAGETKAVEAWDKVARAMHRALEEKGE